MTLSATLSERFARAFYGRRVSTVANDNRPRAYAGPYPIRSHRSLAELWGIGPDGGDAA